ncbi:hypothetical protein GCM10027277_14360 [Pseudoduganella ginsengisoli]|uniref:Peptidase M61 catalytic domain-containing protein n=1 Tax=Pseudoduganella ginsengisoli TaxID=1462440 RepID=A0A6L6PUT6_9BURK|nr:hypothetical protein [Pseudoduganella ginsengisoli]MTW01303.1 hypothetical protein [Pseudoduganella ginsengisoli]
MNPTLSFALLGAALALPVCQAADVEVSVRLAEPDALEVSYQLPPGCDSLPFVDSSVARANWAPAGQCGKVEAGALVRTDSACTALAFRIPAAATFRGYPAAYPMGAGEGIYLHTSLYAPADRCGAVHYRFGAPGSIVTGAQAHAGRAALDGPQAGDTAVLLLQKKLAPSDGALRYFDSRLSPAARAQVARVADGTAAYLRKRLPDVPFTQPALAASIATAPGGPEVNGNGGDLMRLIFFNWPEQPGVDEQYKMTLLVAHEMSHRFQLRDALDGYPSGRLIHEGGAEFLRWMASIGNGWITPEQAAQNLDDELARCMVQVEGRSWGELPQRFISGNTLEYACGLPALVYALAARQGNDTVWSRIGGFYRELRQGKQPDFSRSLECGNDEACQPRWLPALTGRQGAMADHWRKLFADTGLAHPREPGPRTRKAILLKAVGQLMEDDCGGHKGTMDTPQGIFLFGRSECKTLKTNVELRRTEGHPLTGDPAAMPAMAAACAARGAVQFESKDGGTLQLSCQRLYRAPDVFYGADIGKVLARLRDKE